MARLIVAPAGTNLRLDLRELWQHRELLYFLVQRDLKVRYAQTYLGAGWAILQPLMMMVLFSVVFGRMARIRPEGGGSYALFAYAALAPWTYFATALASGANSLVGSQNLISKVYFPRLIVPLAAVITPLADFAIALLVLAPLMLWYGTSLTSSVLVAPAFLVLVIAAALAVSLWLAALNVEFRDVRHVLPFLTQFWLFATPVAYPATLVPERWRDVYALNPMVSVVEGFRWALLGTPAPAAAGLLVSAAAVLFLFIGGVVYFRRVEGTFVDVI